MLITTCQTSLAFSETCKWMTTISEKWEALALYPLSINYLLTCASGLHHVPFSFILLSSSLGVAFFTSQQFTLFWRNEPNVTIPSFVSNDLHKGVKKVKHLLSPTNFYCSCKNVFFRELLSSCHHLVIFSESRHQSALQVFSQTGHLISPSLLNKRAGRPMAGLPSVMECLCEFKGQHMVSNWPVLRIRFLISNTGTQYNSYNS